MASLVHAQEEGLLPDGARRALTLLDSICAAQIDTTMVKEAFIAGAVNGLKPLNAAALKYVDQVQLSSKTPLPGKLRFSLGNRPPSIQPL
jgi:predicted dinucleotide-utilizing enzyme